MGAAHVSAVYARWGHLPHRPFRLLVYMALIAKDSTPNPTFWGGRDGLCIGLGLPANDTGHRVARRAIADLEAAGAIERAYTGHNGKRSEYTIVLGSPKGDKGVPLKGQESSDKGGQESPPKGGQKRASRGTPVSGKGDTSVPPRNTEEERSEKEEEISSSTKPSPTADDDKTTSPEITPLEAKRIVREAIDAGVILSEITQGHTFRNRVERDIFIATEITRRAAS